MNLKIGEFLGVNDSKNERLIIAKINHLFFINPKFQNMEFIFFNVRKHQDLNDIDFVNKNTFLLGDGKILGYITNSFKNLEPIFSPPEPGSEIRQLNEEEIIALMHFNKNGLNVGKLIPYEIPLTLDIDRFLNRHVAVLAMTGSGKTFFTKIFIKRMLEKNSPHSIIIFDLHGEYEIFRKLFPKKTVFINANEIKIDTKNLNTSFLKLIDPNITDAQIMEFYRVFDVMNENFTNFDLKKIIDYIKESFQEKRSTKSRLTREILINRIKRIDALDIFYYEALPPISKLLSNSKLFVINMKHITSFAKKQIILTHILSKVFFYKTTFQEKNYPPILIVIEEIQNFASTRIEKESISRKIIQRISREGRKFDISLWLTSQRPVQIDVTTLSQCNTFILFRIINPYDLDLIGKISDFITKEQVSQIPDLNPGSALIVGQAVKFPVFVKITSDTDFF